MLFIFKINLSVRFAINKGAEENLFAFNSILNLIRKSVCLRNVSRIFPFTSIAIRCRIRGLNCVDKSCYFDVNALYSQL